MNNVYNYVIISPVRNEEEFIIHTLESVCNQSIRPIEWIIVDDGSTDSTPEIILEFIKTHSWIKYLRRNDRGYPEPGRGIIEAFYYGFENLSSSHFDFIVKLDGDLSFKCHYFETIFSRFKDNPRLGIASGICFILKNGHLVEEKHPRFHTRGPTKIYRKECFDQIGGLIKHLGWDTLDEIKANYLGWQTSSFEDLHLTHFKPTGFNTGSFRWAVKLGSSNYYTGYHPLFMVAKALYRLPQKPFVLGSVAILFGYYRNLIARKKTIVSPDLRHFLRREQIKRLVGLKSLWR